MEWITGIQNAIDYIEDNITEQIDYNELARLSYSSCYHFQRVFSIICGYTIGEYIRNRRLTLAGIDLSVNKTKVIDTALKYGYDSPDSFTKAFTKFHGITPSAARASGAELKSFARLSIKITLEGGEKMNYKIEKKEKITFVGAYKHFEGDPSDRYNQAHDFCVSGDTRFTRYAVQGLSKDCDNEYHVINNISDDGYTFTVGTTIDKYYLDKLEETLDSDNVKKLNIVEVESNDYLIVTSEKTPLAILDHMELRKKAVTEWFPNSCYQLSNAPEIVHFYDDNAKPNHDDSYLELWLPIEKINHDC